MRSTAMSSRRGPGSDAAADRDRRVGLRRRLPGRAHGLGAARRSRKLDAVAAREAVVAVVLERPAARSRGTSSAGARPTRAAARSRARRRRTPTASRASRRVRAHRRPHDLAGQAAGELAVAARSARRSRSSPCTPLPHALNRPTPPGRSCTNSFFHGPIVSGSNTMRSAGAPGRDHAAVGEPDAAPPAPA